MPALRARMRSPSQESSEKPRPNVSAVSSLTPRRTRNCLATSASGAVFSSERKTPCAHSFTRAISRRSGPAGPPSAYLTAIPARSARRRIASG